MRFAPPPTVRVADHPGGMNQVLARSFNERLIMSLLLQHDGMTRLQLGQESGLSAQTISVIVRALERDNLISKGEAVRGRIGPPTTPISINPQGGVSIGLHVDYDAVEAAVINFTGQAIIERRTPLQQIDVLSVKEALVRTADALLEDMKPDHKKVVAGIGLTLPGKFETGGPNEQDVLAHDFEADLRLHTGLEVFIQNDITATASSETLFGRAKLMDDLLFCYVSEDLKPRLILGGRIYAGTTPQISICPMEDWRAVQASLRQGEDGKTGKVDWWTALVAEKLSELVTDLGKFAKVPNLILSAPASDDIIEELVSRVRSKTPPGISVDGSKLGPTAISIGAATLPIHSRFTAEA